MSTKRNLTGSCLGLLMMIIGMTFSSTTSAQLMGISVNFQGSGSAMLSTDVAGIVPLSNWNNITSAASWTNLNSANLVDSSGGATSAKFSINYGYSSAGVGNKGPLAGDNAMLGGSMVYTSAATINLTGISYSLVDVYVYVGPGESGKYGNANYNGSVNIGSTTYYYTNINNAADYVLGTDTVGPANVAAGADYVKFSNVSISGGSLKINLQAFNWGNTGIYGFQIVDVSAIPEPSTYALLLTGVLLLAGLRVRDRKRI